MYKFYFIKSVFNIISLTKIDKEEWKAYTDNLVNFTADTE